MDKEATSLPLRFELFARLFIFEGGYLFVAGRLDELSRSHDDGRGV